MSSEMDSMESGKQSFIVKVKIGDRTYDFEAHPFQEKGELIYLVFHNEFGEETMRINMTSGNLEFSPIVDEIWRGMEDEIAKGIEARNL